MTKSLKFNTFQFNGDFYSQTGGVAMGTKMGPSFACLFVGYLEERMFSEFNGPIPDLYKRYRDDVLVYHTKQIRNYSHSLILFHPIIQLSSTPSPSVKLACLFLTLIVK